MRTPNPKKLTVRWDKKENCLMTFYPRKCDGNLALDAFCAKRVAQAPASKPKTCILDYFDFDPSFREELEKRGYDITTLKFSVELKKP